jgi:His Kinase A (phospho-acceptor) domain
MDSWLESFARANFVRSGDTAHDLKTPLNVAVLNLELLRIRVRKLTGGDDARLADYARAIELELRRMARIIDAFFVLSTPPTNDGEPAAVDVCAICNEVAAQSGYEVRAEGRRIVRAHDARIRQALKLFFDGAARVLAAAGRSADVSCNSHFRLTISGRPEAEDFELTKIFKFYYTDPLGNPDLSLAAARLIAETYGGEINGREESGRVSIGISLPLGEE